jgi:hypothetical protein
VPALALSRFCGTFPSNKEIPMPRTLRIVLFAAVTMAVACKTDKPATKAAETKKDPAKPTEGTKPSPALPTDPADPAAGKNTPLQDKQMEMLGRMADVFVANAKDCDKLAAEIRKVRVEHKELLAQINDAEIKQSPEERAAAMDRNKAATEAATAKMQPVVTACANNQTFLAALRDTPQ